MTVQFCGFFISQAVWEVDRIYNAGPSRHSICSTRYRDIMRVLSNVDGDNKKGTTGCIEGNRNPEIVLISRETRYLSTETYQRVSCAV